jgi:hypothetical protein
MTSRIPAVQGKDRMTGMVARQAITGVDWCNPKGRGEPASSVGRSLIGCRKHLQGLSI